MVLDGTESGFVKHKAESNTKNPVIARILTVYEHTIEGDNSNFEVDAVSLDKEFQHNGIPLIGGGNDSINVPKVGDKVLIEYLQGHKKYPVALSDTVFTNQDRAVIGKAGMKRSKVESGQTPTGDGDLYVTEYTTYDGDPSREDKVTLTPEQSLVQIAKKTTADQSVNPPMTVEVFDDPKNQASHINIEIFPEQIPEHDQQGSMRFKLNATDNTLEMISLPTGDSNDANIDPSLLTEGGFKFWLNDGSFKFLDGQGYGLVMNGQGKLEKHIASESVVGTPTDFTTSGYEDIGP